jgi:DNA invertase Pin-like site-specific DNA recombinase
MSKNNGSKLNGEPFYTSPRVFSYIRFSTDEQSLGDSERRQIEDADSWVKRKGLVLDPLDLTDRGMSGYHGVHRTRGKLGHFLALVEAGMIPSGSTLLVENLDRLGREGPATTLRQIIFTLWDRGIVLQTIRPEETYGPGCENEPKFIVLILYLQRAWDESQRKSDLACANWRKKQEEASEHKKLLTRTCPAWLTVTADESFAPIPAAVEAIRTIFDLKRKGVGLGTIEQKLNAGGFWVPPLKKGGGRPKKDGSRAPRQQTVGWRISYIKKILVNRAVLGEYQPYRKTAEAKREPAGPVIPNYFPAIVAPEVFSAVQANLEANQGKGGRTAKVANLLAHLVKCAYCGGPMAFSDRGKKGDRWLICDNGRRGVRKPDGTPICARHSMKYEECERLILDNLPGLRPEQVLPDPDDRSTLCRSLRQRVEGKDAERSHIEKQIGNLIDQIADTADRTIRNRYESRVKELQDRQATLKAERDTDEAELRKVESSVQSFEAWKRNLASLRRALRGGDVEVRLKLRSHLRELIDRIEVFAVGGQRYEPWVEDRTEGGEPAYWFGTDHWLPLHEAEPFMEYVSARLGSKEGRFIRVHFKVLAGTGVGVDLAPDGSLARCSRLTRPQEDIVDQWIESVPSFDRLWREFRATERPAGERRRCKG